MRSYADRSVEPTLLERLLIVAAHADSVGGAPPRVGLISGVDATERVLTSVMGSYGMVQNAPHLLVGIIPKESERARVDLSCILEHVVLEATRPDLGACWITGTFDAGRAEQAVGYLMQEGLPSPHESDAAAG